MAIKISLEAKSLTAVLRHAFMRTIMLLPVLVIEMPVREDRLILAVVADETRHLL